MFLDFYLRFCGLRFQSTNSSVVELFLDDFHDVSRGVMNYRSCMERIGSKSGKRSKSGQNFAWCCGPAFFTCVPTQMGETRFLVVVGKPFKKTVWSRHLFLFYFKG